MLNNCDRMTCGKKCSFYSMEIQAPTRPMFFKKATTIRAPHLNDSRWLILTYLHQRNRSLTLKKSFANLASDSCLFIIQFFNSNIESNITGQFLFFCKFAQMGLELEIFCVYKACSLAVFQPFFSLSELVTNEQFSPNNKQKRKLLIMIFKKLTLGYFEVSHYLKWQGVCYFSCLTFLLLEKWHTTIITKFVLITTKPSLKLDKNCYIKNFVPNI